MKAKLLNLVRQDLLEDALDLLIEYSEEKGEIESNECLQLSGRLTGLNRKIGKGTISPEQASIERAQIREGILSIIDQLED